MSDVVERLRELVTPARVQAGEEIAGDDTHDEALTGCPVAPLAVVRPATTEEVSRVLALADAQRVPVVARGAATGLSGGCRPTPGAIVVAFDRMNRVLEVDGDNHVAVVQAGVTLAALDEAVAPHRLVYPVSPGELSSTLGGNVATNAGGMQAVRYGVTRHHVLGLEAVVPGGEVIRTGGRYVKCSSGYDLTQLIVGSEGTLALVTEVVAKLVPRLTHRATLLAPFPSLALLGTAVPSIVTSGTVPLVLEYVDTLVMAGITAAAGIDLGIPEEVQAATAAHLVVVLESTADDRLDEDVAAVGHLLAERGALDVYVLPPAAGADLIRARERAFFVGKAAGADDIVDTVVPRAAIPQYLATVAELADAHGAVVAGCGHVGDGNVHLSVFLPDRDRRTALLRRVFEAAIDAGGAVSGEHGIGTEKLSYFLDLEDPAKLVLMRRIKAAFDPHGILGPGRLLGRVPA